MTNVMRQVIPKIRADFQQGMESVFWFKMNTDWKILAHLYSSNSNMTLSFVVLFSVTELI